MSESTPIHFTYDSVNTEDDLYQGDIILPTEELHEVIRQIFPYFSNPKYTGFMVLSQTCDLVRGRQYDPCKSLFVNLAVIRPIEDVLYLLLDRVCKKVEINKKKVEGVYCRDTEYKARQLLERIANQNEHDFGLFYLYPDAAVKIPVHSVVFLQINFALAAKFHYDKLVQARRGRLKAEFRNKLGWLLGYLYSRVGTQDVPSDKMKEIKKLFLETNDFIKQSPFWIPDKNVQIANERKIDLTEQERDEALKMLLECKPPPIERKAAEIVVNILHDFLDEEALAPKVEAIKNAIISNPVFTAMLKV